MVIVFIFMIKYCMKRTKNLQTYWHILCEVLDLQHSVVAKMCPLSAASRIRSADLNPADCAIYPLSHTDWLWIFMFVPLHYSPFREGNVLIASTILSVAFGAPSSDSLVANVVAKMCPLSAASRIRSADLNPADCAIYPLSHTDWLWIFMFVPLQ